MEKTYVLNVSEFHYRLRHSVSLFYLGWYENPMGNHYTEVEGTLLTLPPPFSHLRRKDPKNSLVRSRGVRSLCLENHLISNLDYGFTPKEEEGNLNCYWILFELN